MEAADCLYGVTMEEPGVSKMIFVHIGEVDPIPRHEAPARGARGDPGKRYPRGHNKMFDLKARLKKARDGFGVPAETGIPAQANALPRDEERVEELLIGSDMV